MAEISELLDEKQTAKKLGVTAGTLCVWRCTKRYPLRFVRVGRRIRYSAADVERFIQLRTCDGTTGESATHPRRRRRREER